MNFHETDVDIQTLSPEMQGFVVFGLDLPDGSPLWTVKPIKAADAPKSEEDHKAERLRRAELYRLQIEGGNEEIEYEPFVLV